jgi:CheY-like chemotaxis protein
LLYSAVLLLRNKGRSAALVGENPIHLARSADGNSATHVASETGKRGARLHFRSAAGLCPVSHEQPLLEIILVDDDPEALHMLQELLARARVANPIRAFDRGEAVIAYLRERGESRAGPLRDICLALVDIRMPGTSGFDVLAWIRSQPGLYFLPVVMLTISDDPADVRRAEELGAHSYLLKFPLPETLAGLIRVAEQMVRSNAS